MTRVSIAARASSPTPMNESPGWSRRRFVAAAALGLSAAACSNRFPAPEAGPFAFLFAGEPDDGGFNSLVLEGITRVESARRIPMRVSSVAADPTAIATALRGYARSDAKMIFGVGAAMAEPIQRVAWELPDHRFTLIQGDLIRPNLAAYMLREEEPAWLAGYLAARLSTRQSIGVLSDLPERRRRRVEDAFRAGAAKASTTVKVVPAAGDGDTAAATAAASLLERVDVVYGALDGVPRAAIEACRAAGAKFIGCPRDWSPEDPDTVVASALLDPGLLVAAATQDLNDAVWRGDFVRSFGLYFPQMVRFALSERLSAALAGDVRSAGLDLASGRVALPG
jgi:basic membrane protein A